MSIKERFKNAFGGMNFFKAIGLGVIFGGIIAGSSFLYKIVPIMAIYIITGLTVAIILIISIVNIKEKVKFNKNFKFDNKELREQVLNHKKEVESQFLSTRKKSLIYICSVFILVSLAVIGISNIIMSISEKNVAFLILLILFFYDFYADILIKSATIKNKDCLSIKEYPKIYKFVNDIAREVGITKKVKVMSTFQDNMSIIYDGKSIFIAIGQIYFRAMSQKELKSILIHEFAHFLNKDSLTSYNHGKVENLLERFVNPDIKTFFGWHRYLFEKVYYEYSMKKAIYELAFGKEREEMADELVKKMGFANDFINSTAKLQYYNMYCFELDDTSIFEKEEPSKNMLDMTFQEFLNKYEKRKDFWKEIIAKMIPAKIDTHPNLIERMKNLGVEEYNVNFQVENVDLKEEVDLIISKMNDDIYKNMQENWEFDRKAEYLDKIEITTSYEKEEVKTQDLALLAKVGNAYLSLFKWEKAVEIFKIMLQIDPKNALGLYYIGVYKLHNYDGDGIEMIKQSIEISSNYIESGLEEIGEFLLMMGCSEKLDEIREWSMNKSNELINNVSEISDLSAKDNIFKADLSEERKERFVKKASEFNCIEKIYLLEKKLNYKDENVYHYGVLIKNKSTNQDVEICYSELFYLLDNMEGELQYNLTFMNKLHPYLKFFKNIDDVVYTSPKGDK